MDPTFRHAALRDGYRTVPLTEADSTAGLRVSVVVGPEGHAHRVRSIPEAEVYAGAVVDGDGAIHDMLEIWVQAETLRPETEGAVDARWQRLRSWLRASGTLISGSWASASLTEASEGVFLSATPAPVLVRRAPSMAFEAFIDWLSSDQLHRPPRERASEVLEWETSAPVLSPSTEGDRGREAEVFYLKLRAFEQAIRSVRDAVRGLDRPLLSLRGSGLSVRLGDSGDLAPGWVARVEVDDPGAALELPPAPGEPRRFVSSGSKASVYAPAELNIEQETSSRLRVVSVLTAEGGGVVIEGVLTPSESIRLGSSMMATIRLPVGSQRYLIRGLLNRDGSVGSGSVGFVSTPSEALASSLDDLRAMQGAEFGEVATSIAAATSTPADLHALGVLGARVLLSASGDDLGRAVDALQVASQALGDASADPGTTLASMVEADERLGRVLGPERLVPGSGATSKLPMAAWWRLIATLARFFPGVSSMSFEPDLGLAPNRPLDSVFEQPLEAVGDLVRQARSLVIVDAPTASEIGALIDRALEK